MAISRLRQPTFYNLSVARAAAYAELGGSATEVGGYRVHTFSLTSDTIEFTSPGQIDYLIVAGGGAGGGLTSSTPPGGGGGAGGLLTGSTTVSVGTYTISVGLGGATASLNKGQNGSDSSISSIGSCIGGGAGGSYPNSSSGKVLVEDLVTMDQKVLEHLVKEITVDRPPLASLTQLAEEEDTPHLEKMAS
jgi:hypothetical protein